MAGGFTPIPVTPSVSGFTPIPVALPPPQASATSPSNSGVNINDFTLDPNILDSYSSYTYNFSLKLYEDSVSKENRLPTSSDKFVVIAESGVTAAFNIKRVEIQNVPGTTRENKGATTTKVKMYLEEPLGFTFIDRLLQAGKALALPCLTTVPYVLELSFVGWDENGIATKPIAPVKSWVLNLLSVLPDLQKGGTHYTLDFARQNEQVQQDVRCKINKTIKFTKGKTLTETLNNFSTAITKAYDIASEGTNYTPAGSRNDPTRLRHIYNFTTQDSDSQLGKLSTWTMASNTSQNTQRQFEMTPSSGSPTQFEIVIQPDKDIFEVLTAILGNTNEAYKFLCPAADPAQAEFNNSEFTNFFHFETATVNTLYDPLTNAYTQTHTVQIIPKVISRNSILTKVPGGTTEVHQLMSNNLFIKGYEYLFTGENTSVLDLNLDFSSVWTDSAALFLTLLAPQTSSNIAPNTVPVNTVLPYVPFPNKSQVIQNSNQTTPFALTANRPDQPTISNFLEDYPSEGLTIESFAKREPDRDYSQHEKITKGYSFAGDQASTAKLSIFGYLADNSFINLNTGKPGVSSMASINMIIRGDPFWLGINSEEIVSLYNNSDYTTLRKSQRNYAVYQSGEQCLYLKLRPPQAIDDNTGLMKFNSSSVFNTLYTVQMVTSIFENGIFKQELQAAMNRSFQAEAVQNTVDPIIVKQQPAAQPQQHGASGSY